MPKLSEQDYQKILMFLQGLYATTSFETFSTYVREAVTELVPAEPAVFATVDFEQRLSIARGPAPHIPGLAELSQNHCHEHPFFRHYSETFDFSAVKLSDFLTEQELHCSEFLYHRFMRYMDAEDNFTLCLPYSSPPSNSGDHNSQHPNIVVDSINLFRGKRSFTERDRTILNLVQPHLLQARETAQSFSRLVQNQQDLQDCLNTSGSVVLGKEGRVRWITRKAENLLKQYFPSFSHIGQTLPEHLKQWVNYQRSQLSRQNGALKPLAPLKIEQCDKLLNVRFAADLTKDQYMLLLSEQKSPALSTELLETLGISKREAEVLFWVIEGKTNAEIADMLYLSISTVRKHIEHIYLKLDVHTRAGVVVQAFRQLGMLNLDGTTVADAR